MPIKNTVKLKGFRLTGIDKQYNVGQIERFALYMQERYPNMVYIEVGKQEQRAAFSICIYNANGCIEKQKSFNSKAELLGFIIGYNSCYNDYGIT